jgi:hypothetical protein
MPRGVKRVMNLVLLAKEHCANWDPTYDRCCFAGPKFSECLLKDGERCGYFERAVLPWIAKSEDSEAVFHYHQSLKQNTAKTGQIAIENKGNKSSFARGVLCRDVKRGKHV